MLIVDQFEQVFTLNPDLGGEATRQAFITALCSAAANPVGPGQVPPALVVLAVRGDFWDQCAAVPELVSALQDGQFVVGPMTESELRVAITGPAEAAGLRIDPALTDTILGDLRAAGEDRSAGVLPLLSQAMALTWEQREGDRLTSHGYAQAGGVSRAVQTGADRAYGALPAGQQAIAPEMLRSMTVARRDGGLARRPVTRDDLYAGLPGAARSDIDAVLDAFAAERLTVLDGDKAQLSHDVLLRAWPRLRGWLEEDQANWILHGQLADAADAWHDSHDDPSFLYRGAQLTALQQAVTRWSADPARYPVLTGTQRNFLRASDRAAARGRLRRRSSLAVLAVLTVLAVAASGVAFYQRAEAVQQRDQAIYNRVIAEALQFGTSNTPLAAQLTLAAYRIKPTQDLVSSLRNTENTPLSSALVTGDPIVTSVAVSSHGHILADGGPDGRVRLWNVADPARPRPLGWPLTEVSALVYSLAFSPDGHTLASGGLDSRIRLWNVADPAHPRPLGRPLASGVPVNSVTFSPDGHTLASGGYDGRVQLWNVADPVHPLLLAPPLGPLAAGVLVNSVAFSPDGHTLASGGPGGRVRLWDVADPAHPRTLGPPLPGGVAVASVAFSPDGHTLAGGGFDGTVWLWDVADPVHPRTLGPILTGGVAVDSVAFSPDGHMLAGGGLDGVVRLWGVADPTHPSALGQPLTGGGGAVDSVAFGRDGRTLASGGVGGTVRLWSLPQTVLTGGTIAFNSVAFGPDGHTLASSGYGGMVRLWGTADPAHPRPLGPPLVGGGIARVAFSPDGHTLAGGGDGTIRLWDVADPAHPTPLGPSLAGAVAVDSVAFSPDRQTLAVGLGDGTVRLWHVADPAHPTPLGQPLAGGGGAVGSVAFSRDGRMLAAGGFFGTRLWGVADPAHPRQQGLIPIGTLDTVAFSHDGRTLASGALDGTVRLWDIADPAHPQQLGPPLTSGTAAIRSVAFSRDGYTLASGGLDGTVRLWDVADPAHPQPLGQPLTSGVAVDSVAFSRDGHTLASGSDDGTTRLWNLNVQYAIERICATAGGLTPREWNKYMSELRYQPSCIP